VKEIDYEGGWILFWDCFLGFFWEEIDRIAMSEQANAIQVETN
jgi:hypothetical protein